MESQLVHRDLEDPMSATKHHIGNTLSLHSSIVHLHLNRFYMQNPNYLGNSELKAELWTIIMVKNRPEGILFQGFAYFPHSDPYLLYDLRQRSRIGTMYQDEDKWMQLL